jgi:hypothetical protein
MKELFEKRIDSAEKEGSLEDLQKLQTEAEVMNMYDVVEYANKAIQNIKYAEEELQTIAQHQKRSIQEMGGDINEIKPQLEEKRRKGEVVAQDYKSRIQELSQEEDVVYEQETQAEVFGVDEGVDYAFEVNKKLSDIGSKEEYKEYINSIFLEKGNKSIVYHGSPQKFESFDSEILHKKEKKPFNWDAVYTSFTKTGMPEDWNGGTGNIMPVLVNIKNTLSTEVFDATVFDKVLDEIKARSGGTEISEQDIEELRRMDFDSLTNTLALHYGVNFFESIGYDSAVDLYGSLVVFSPNHTHILGTENDMQGFKTYMQEKKSDEIM